MKLWSAGPLFGILLAAVAASPGVHSGETGLRSSAAAAIEWSSLAPLPDAIGFGGMYAGASGGALIAAGGANFPSGPGAAGGKKIWYDNIFVLSRPEGPWRTVGRLPQPLGYGICANWRDAVACVGGGNGSV